LRDVDLTATVRRPAMRKRVLAARARSIPRGLWLVLFPLWLQACPSGGRLTDVDEHLAAQTCDTPQIFQTSCSGVLCHTPGPSGNVTGVIDLVTPGFEAALIDKPSDYSAVDDDSTCPAPGTELIVDTADPLASLLITKTTGDHACGLPMPPPEYDQISDADKDCIRSWTIELAESAGGVGGAAGAAGSAGGPP